MTLGVTAQTFVASWPVPATQGAGSYRLVVAVFSAGWSSMYSWINSAATITVLAAAATPTGTASPLTTGVPPTATATGGVPTATAPASGGVALGVSEPGSPWDGGTALDAFSSAVGRTPAVVNWYEDWPSTGFSTNNFNVVVARGAMPMLSWNPCSPSNTMTNGQTCNFQAIANGVSDSYLHTWAQAAAAWGKPFYLRLAWEMTTLNPAYTPASYVAMWQHVHAIFVSEGATNVRWYWCPNGIGNPTDYTYAQMYPGDSYVDAVGFDAYNWGTTQSWSAWGDLYSIWQPAYAALVGLTNKPIIIGEVGSVEQGGSKAQWITQGFLTSIPTSFPKIASVVWFDENQSPENWRIDSSSSSLAAYQQVVASPLFHGQLH